MRPGELAALDALLRVDRERDERADQGGRVEPEPRHVTELTEGKLVEQLLATTHASESAHARRKGRESRLLTPRHRG